MTRQSMTGFARLDGQAGPANWQWEVRSVNGRGLDLRLRLPEGLEQLEKQIRSVAARHLTRGNVNLTLRLGLADTAGAGTINPVALGAALEAVRLIEQAAVNQSVTLAPVSAVELMGRPGVLESAGRKGVDPALADRIAADIEPLFQAFQAARLAEGASIKDILTGQIDQLETLIAQAQASAEARKARDGTLLAQKVRDLLEVTELADEARLQQELALIAVKADVTEEIDRLNTHVEAAKTLLADPNAVGRKFDFLMQEFNREANTLCSKSGSAELTSIGLDLKTVIDQMREQVQNLE